jgi:hypothetical protein
MRKVIGFAAFGLAAFFLALAPARAQNPKLDDRIEALEQELLKLKSEQQQVRTEQLELKREATEAAAALPEFSYRPAAA